MYKGKPASGLEFYNLLFESEEFTSELGKVALASGKLEAELMLYLKRKGITKDLNKSTLGTLTKIAEQTELLDSNQLESLKMVTIQRNYITHNIYALFTDIKEETILEKYNLLDSDVFTYIERAWQLKENLIALAENLRNAQ